ncbi:A disintegrin and metallopeptidase domain 3-like isoform X6 [Callithrix jacchus]|uniref:A disintegrin and metallopeptidase domain 3-like isoform X6 n=1 Tax=Callithrix jacchus TaxID=9483 RepID=UPI0023DD2E56|nr:A disintegrin and metallopeptidase domain 3-like isoform X6 [Callithrix jacchus]
MLSHLLILSGVTLLTTAGPNSETPVLQITVPRKIQTNTDDGDVSETHATYSIKIEGKSYTFLLEKQSFLHPRFLVYLYNESGILHRDSSFSNINLGRTDIFTMLSFPIQKRRSLLLSRICCRRSKVSCDTTYLFWTQYDYMGSAVAVAVDKVFQIFGLINTMFSQLNMTVMLSSLEIWSDQDKISTSGHADELLQRFLSWKQKFLSQRSHDMTYLLVYRNHSTYVGATYHGMACDPKFATGIALYPKKITLEAFSVVMAQLLGINLGLTYDATYNCYCPGTTCIMSPDAIRSNGMKFFSSCSVDEFKQIVLQPELKCLQDKTISKMTYQGKAETCGNGILEPTEQCDCGNAEGCNFKKCCNPKDCTLIGFAECGTGPCCNNKTCTIHERGQICRNSIDMCDFPEYCNGTSEFCVPDVKAADLEYCNNKTSYCFEGVCRDRDKHCVKLFGKFAKSASILCTEEVNFLNDKFGNCGSRCNFYDILCGKIVCHWTHSQLVSVKDYDIQYTYLGGHVCFSAHARNGTEQMTTYTETLTMCGQHKACQSKQCKFLGDINIEKCNKTCGGNGVCNEHFNCHCDPGYAPPNCEQAISSPGGSIDDGYWLSSEKSEPLFPKRRAAPKHNGLLISFYVFLPLLVLIAIVILTWNKMKRFWSKAGTVSSRSISEDSSSTNGQSQS